MPTLPNLFRDRTAAKTAEWYYNLFLARLHQAHRAARIVQVCRTLRRFAKDAGKPKSGLFTYQWEMHACEDAGDVNRMWRALRAWDRAAVGRAIDLARYPWKTSDTHRLLFYYAPLLYLRGRYRLGCQLLETALRLQSRRKGWSFELLWHVYKPLERPSAIYDVTLHHFYLALGRDLRDWPFWKAFVDGFHPKLFRLSGVSRDSLRSDPALLKPLFEWITAERRRRLFTHTTMGEVDLV